MVRNSLSVLSEVLVIDNTHSWMSTKRCAMVVPLRRAEARIDFWAVLIRRPSLRVVSHAPRAAPDDPDAIADEAG